MKRKILITIVVLAAGLGALLVYEWSAEIFQNTVGFRHFRAPAFVTSAVSSLGVEGVGIIVMVVVIIMGVILFRRQDD
jgi:hypothetical protein